jgi:hypothetical protein
MFIQTPLINRCSGNLTRVDDSFFPAAIIADYRPKPFNHRLSELHLPLIQLITLPLNGNFYRLK